MKPIASSHFLDRITERGIDDHIVQLVLDHPDSVVREEELLVYQKVVELSSKSFLVRIFVNDSKVPPVLVTAYQTNKISKYIRP